MILSGSAFEWIPVIAPRRDKPSWAISASSGTVEPDLLTEARIDPLPTVSTNLSLFLVLSICPFTFELPALDNLGRDDMSDLAAAYGPTVVEWAQAMLLAHAQGNMAITPTTILRARIRSCVTLAPGLANCPLISTCTDHAPQRSHAHLAHTQTIIRPCFPASAGPRSLPPFFPRYPFFNKSPSRPVTRRKRKTTWPLGTILSSPS